MDRGPLNVAIDPEVQERRIAVGLLVATCASVFLVYLLRWQEGPWIDGSGGAAWRALLFTGALMGILLAHELGHWLTARSHAIRLALPWFLPAPVLVGTFGAVIRWSDVPRTRTGWLEMAAMGPLAGLVAVIAAVGVWLIGGAAPMGHVVLARPMLWWIASFALTGRSPPTLSAEDPLAFAAAIGALVTAMNLVPIGQLDGGHVAGALFPDHARTISRVATVLLLAMGLIWPGWAVWAALANLIGGPAEPPRDRKPPTRRARAIAVACVLAFALCFTPRPM